MPEVIIFPAYGAGAMVAIRTEVPATVTAGTIKGLAGHERSAYVFARLNQHGYDKRCPCWACVRTPKGDWRPISWARVRPGTTWHRWLRMDIGQRNVRLNVTGGEFFVVVAEVDIRAWLAELIERYGRAAMLLTLPLYTELARRAREVGAA